MNEFDSMPKGNTNEWKYEKKQFEVTIHVNKWQDIGFEMCYWKAANFVNDTCQTEWIKCIKIISTKLILEQQSLSLHQVQIPVKRAIFSIKEELPHDIHQWYIIVATGVNFSFFDIPWAFVHDMLYALEEHHHPIYCLKLIHLTNVQDCSFYICPSLLYLLLTSSGIVSGSKFWWLYHQFHGLVYWFYNGTCLFISDVTLKCAKTAALIISAKPNTYCCQLSLTSINLMNQILAETLENGLMFPII